MHEILPLSAAVGSTAFTISRTKVFEPIRSRVMRKSKWFGTLLSCPYCIGHWLALVATGLYRPYVTDLNPVLDFGVAWLTMVMLSSIAFGIIGRGMKESLP